MSNPTKILIVDDSPEDIRLLMNELKSEFQITAATSADDALQMISETLPDIVLMDINMPEMDGFETTVWLKKNHPDIKVLVLSM